MPFGLSNATATFQRLMSRGLMDVTQSYGNLVMCYADDVIIATGSIDDNIDRIGEVLSRLRQAGLKCKPTKCEFLNCSIIKLGRVVDREGARPDPDSVESGDALETSANYRVFWVLRTITASSLRVAVN